MGRREWRIAVLCGGDSSERDISLQSGEAVAAALDERGHYVRLIDVRHRSLEPLDGFDCDVAFIAMHGEFGEDGQIQLLLGMRGIPYTGSGIEASRLAMDKPAAKELFAANDIRTPQHFVLDATCRLEEIRSAVISMGFPQIVKPAREGSSIGVTLARSVPEAMDGLRTCLQLGDEALIERWIRGRELTVAIVGHRTLPIIELVYPTLFFNKYAKYTAGVARHLINPDLPEAVDERVRLTALAAHTTLGCRDFSRVDLVLGEDHQPYVLEVNTIPGLTPISLVPDAARAAGIEFGELCEMIVRPALRRVAARGRTLEQGTSEWPIERRQ